MSCGEDEMVPLYLGDTARGRHQADPFAEQLEQHARKAVERVCLEALTGGDVLGQGVVAR